MNKFSFACLLKLTPSFSTPSYAHTNHPISSKEAEESCHSSAGTMPLLMPMQMPVSMPSQMALNAKRKGFKTFMAGAFSAFSVFSALALMASLPSSVDAATMSCSTEGHWRDVAYQDPPMKQYEPLKECVAWTAYQFNLPEELLYSVLYVERGPLNGKCNTNRNRTQDCGPAQINDVRLSELKKFHLTKADIRQKPCINVWAMGYLLRREIEKAGGNIWTGVGNYHFHYSVNQEVHDKYVNRIRDAWQTLVTSTYNFCIEDDGKKN